MLSGLRCRCSSHLPGRRSRWAKFSRIAFMSLPELEERSLGTFSKTKRAGFKTARYLAYWR